MTENGRKRIYAIVFGLILTGITLAGLEMLASFEAPSWPARALRSTPPGTVQSSEFAGLAAEPWVFEPNNSWGMREKDRRLAKPAGGGPAARSLTMIDGTNSGGCLRSTTAISGCSSWRHRAG